MSNPFSFEPKKPATFFVAPFGPYNEFLDFNRGSLYVESGVVTLKTIAYANIATYYPETLYTSKEWCPISGYLKVLSTTEPAAGGCLKPKAHAVIGENKTANQSESLAFGCEKKVDSVDCMNPLGNKYNVSRHELLPRTFITPPIFPVAMWAAAEAEMGYAYIQWQEAFAKSLVDYSIDRTTEVNSSNFQGGGNTCDCSLMNKKNLLKNQLHPQSFSGKTRLFLQAQFGTNVETIYIKPGISEPSYWYKGIVPLPKDEEMYPKRHLQLDQQVIKLHTDADGNYYIMLVSYDVLINPLVPSGEGLLLQKWLKTQSLSKNLKAAYEAYILASCTPTKYVRVAGANLDVTFTTSLGTYGWKSNWRGNELSVVTLDWETPCHSVLSQLNISMTGGTALYEAEEARKLASAIEQAEAAELFKTMTAEEKASLTPELKLIYIPNSPIIVSESGNPPVKSYCPRGDINDGLWEWTYINDVNGTAMANGLDALKTKNKKDGKLPYSPEFFEALGSAFSVESSTIDEGTFKVKYDSDRIFTWDEMFGVYDLELSFNVRKNLEGITGAGPIYCFYDDHDLLKVVRYSNVAQDPTPQIVKDQSPYDCGDTYYIDSKIIGSGGEATTGTFSIGSYEVVRPSHVNFSITKSEGAEWGLGSNMPCGHYPPHPGPCNIVYCGGYFYKNIRGGGFREYFAFNGTQLTKICVVIPKHECEAVYLAQLSDYRGVHILHRTNASQCVVGQMAAPRRSATYWEPCFHTEERCHDEHARYDHNTNQWLPYVTKNGNGDCCSRQVDYSPIPDQNYGPGNACSYGLGPTMAPNGAIYDFDIYAYTPWDYSVYRDTEPTCPGEELKLIPQGIFRVWSLYYNSNFYTCKSVENINENEPNSVNKELKVYLITKSSSELVIQETIGYGDLSQMASNGTVKGRTEQEAELPYYIYEWMGSQKFLGHIKTDYPYIDSLIDVNQSALGAYWAITPKMHYSNDYPFDKKGRYFIGAS